MQSEMQQFTIDRQQYDAIQQKCVELFCGCPREMSAEAIKFSYPIATAAAIQEARARGFLANQYECGQFLQTHGQAVPIVGKSRCWSREAVDGFCDWLAARNLYMEHALARKANGETSQEYVDALAAKLDEQIAEAKAALESEERVCQRVAGMKETFASN